MRIKVNIKGLSTIALILLIILAAIIGGLISYAFTIANYTKIPEETTLAITEVHINKESVRSFNISVLNPSYSPTSTTISRIAISLKNGTHFYDVVETNPSIKDGLEIRSGESVNITCLKIRMDKVNVTFGEFVINFAGETIIIHVFAEGSSAANMEATLPFVKLNIAVDFEKHFTESIQYFNLTIENLQPEPSINLTISEVLVQGELIKTLPSLPFVLMPNQKEIVVCMRNWDDLKWVNIKITVRTVEGYELSYVTSELPGANIYIDEIKFDYDDTSYLNVTVSSSAYSTGIVYISRLDLTLEGEEPKTLNTSYPTNINKVPVSLLPNQSITLKCLWDWRYYRNKTITVTVYTKQGIKTQSYPFMTPPDVVWEITDVRFDLENTDFFVLDITNKLCSLQNIIVTNIKLDDKNVSIVNPQQFIRPGEQATINCSISWRNFGVNVTVSVNVTVEDGAQVLKVASICMPQVKLSILDQNFTFGEFVLSNITITIPYVNVTVYNSKNSLLNVTITKITLEILYEDDEYSEKKIIEMDKTLTFPQLPPDGYTLKINETVTFTCLSNWSLYLTPESKRVTVTIYTKEDFQASRTWYSL